MMGKRPDSGFSFLSDFYMKRETLRKLSVSDLQRGKTYPFSIFIVSYCALIRLERWADWCRFCWYL